MSLKTAALGVAAMVACSDVQAWTEVVHNAEEMVQAMRGTAYSPPPNEIVVQGTIVFDSAYQDTGNALPAYDAPYVVIRGGGPDAALVAGAPGFRLITITKNSTRIRSTEVNLRDLEIRGFETSGNGGVVRADQWGKITARNVTFRNNRANGVGGVIYAADARYTYLVDNRFVHNSAGAGCALALKAGEALLTRNVFLGSCQQGLVRIAEGTAKLASNTFVARGGSALTFKPLPDVEAGGIELFGNIFVQLDESGKALCDLPGDADTGNLSTESHGDNIATDNSCGLEAPSDVAGVSPESVLRLSTLPVPMPDGPALDTVVPASLPAFKLPCPLLSSTGLPMPQDGNGDGIFGCDSGAIEKQGGPDIGAPQTGVYFAPSRPGEGYFVEMLGDGRAVVTFFTYGPVREGAPAGTAMPRWFFGVGEVVGNAIFVEKLNTFPAGPEFTDYDPADLGMNSNTKLSLVFADCSSVNNLGRAAFDHSYVTFSTPPPGGGSPHFDELYTGLARLTSVVGCDGEPTSARSGLSGIFYAPVRDGEGIVVQWLDENRVLAVWGTFTPEGRQTWMISHASEVNGKTVTLQMFYPSTTTGFGPHFDADEIEFSKWGTVTLEYTGCNSIRLHYDSIVAGYGSGEFTYSRLTQPAGTQCSM